jgi:hypothetical protein
MLLAVKLAKLTYRLASSNYAIRGNALSEIVNGNVAKDIKNYSDCVGRFPA